MQRALTWIFLVLTLVALASPTLAADVEPQKKQTSTS